MIHDRLLLERCFRGYVLPVLEYCSAVWCSAADTHLKLLDRAVSGAWFLTVGVFECDIAHRRSVAVLCMLYKIRCNPMLLLNMVLYLDRMCQCELHAVPWAHIGISMRMQPRCTTLQYHRTFVSLSVSFWNALADPEFNGLGLADFKSRANIFLTA